MRKSIYIFVVSSYMAVPLSLWAQDGLSLEQALRIAYLSNPRMIEARLEIEASKGRRIQAEALPDPEVEFEAGGLKRNGSGERDGNLDSFSIKQPLDPLGTRFLNARIANDEVHIAKNGLEAVWAEVRKQVIETYSRILAGEKAGEIAQDNLNAARQFFTSVETKFQSGSALQSDVLRSKIELSRMENDALIAQKNLKVSKGELNLLLGREAEKPLSLSDSLSYEALQYQYEKIKTEAIGQRADVKAESRRLSARRKGVWAAILKTFFPRMTIGVERTMEDYENDTSILLAASYPLWGFNLGQVKEAKAEKDIQEIRLHNLERQAGLDVYRAFLEAEFTDKQVTLHKKSLEEANELLRQITIQYEEGEIPFLIYLENIKTIKETRLSYFDALRDYKEKVAELERVIQAAPAPEGINI